ncbi:MAG: ABC transporter permease [Coxiellaceae bacterium]|nr:ABC transporter permease [Coxiellaceae bacterium]
MNPIKMWHAFYGLFRKQVIRILRIWPQVFLPSIINTILYFIIFGGVLGARVGLIDGFDYMTFIAPGLIMMAIIINSYSNVVSAFYSERFIHSIDEILVSPMPDWLMISSFVGGGIFRGVILGIILMIVSLFFTSIDFHHWFLILVTLFLSSCLFSLAGFFNGIFARKFDDTAIITTFVLTPLIYLGGVFYEIDKLPGIWQTISRLNPIHIVIEQFRYAMLGKAPDYNEYFTLTMLFAFNIILFAICWWCVRKGYGIKS